MHWKSYSKLQPWPEELTGAYALQDSLGGNAKTSLVVAITDAVESTNETLDSLNFGAHCDSHALANSCKSQQPAC